MNISLSVLQATRLVAACTDLISQEVGGTLSPNAVLTSYRHHSQLRPTFVFASK